MVTKVLEVYGKYMSRGGDSKLNGIYIPCSHTELLTLSNVCSLCIMSICNFLRFSFGFRGQDFGSDCTGSWSLFLLYFSGNKRYWKSCHYISFYRHDSNSQCGSGKLFFFLSLCGFISIFFGILYSEV